MSGAIEGVGLFLCGGERIFEGGANRDSGGVAGGGWLAMGGLKGVPAGWVWVEGAF